MRAAWALVLLSVALAHGNSLHSPFHFDDFHSIVDNAALRSVAEIPRYFTDLSAFSPLAENRAYRPILLVGFAVSHAIADGQPWGYHLITLLLHALGACAVCALARRLLIAQAVEARVAAGCAAFAGALIAVHPLVTEPVSYVSSRSSLQAAVLMWLAIWAWIRAREDGWRPGIPLAFALLTLAMGTKITAMTGPALIVLWEWGFGRRAPTRAPRGAIVALGVLTLALVVGHELVVGEVARAGRSTVPRLHYLLTMPEVLARFIGLFVWPEGLCADLTMPWRTRWWEGPVARAVLLHGVLLTIALVSRRRRPMITFGVLWFYVALSPTSSIAPLSEPASEHRAYIGLPGLVFALLGWIGPRLVTPPRRALAAVFASCALVALTLAAQARNRVWQSDLSLWADVVERSPDNGRAHLNLGLAKLSRADRAGARASFDRCAEAWPGFAFCYINHAALALEERRLSDAERSIAIAERLLPSNVYVLLWRGNVERAAERWASAERAYLATLAVAPGHLGARAGQAYAVFMQGRIDEASPLLAGLARDGALDAHGHYARGYLADRAGDPVSAEAAYREALRLDPRQARAAYNLGVLRQRAGDLLGAIELYSALDERGEATPDALFNLASALWQVGQADRARRVRAELTARAPDHRRLAELAF